LAHWRRAGEKQHLVGVGRGLNRGWVRGSGLGSSLAEFQGHEKPTSRVGQVIFALRSNGEQVEMLAGMLEVLLAWDDGRQTGIAHPFARRGVAIADHDGR
jgi:hypothetical protein